MARTTALSGPATQVAAAPATIIGTKGVIMVTMFARSLLSLTKKKKEKFPGKEARVRIYRRRDY
jgi:hypothetical protein